MLRTFLLITLISPLFSVPSSAGVLRECFRLVSRIHNFYLSDDAGRKMVAATRKSGQTETFELSSQGTGLLKRKILIEHKTETILSLQNNKILVESIRLIKGLEPMGFDLPKNRKWNLVSYFRNEIRPVFFAQLQANAIKVLKTQELAQRNNLPKLWSLNDETGQTVGFQVEGPSSTALRFRGRFLLRGLFQNGFVKSFFLDTGYDQKVHSSTIPLSSLFSESGYFIGDFKNPLVFIRNSTPETSPLTLPQLSRSQLIGIDPRYPDFYPVDYTKQALMKVVIFSGEGSGLMGRIQSPQEPMTVRLQNGLVISKNANEIIPIFDYLIEAGIDPLKGLPINYKIGDTVIYLKTGRAAEIVEIPKTKPDVISGLYVLAPLDGSKYIKTEIKFISPREYYVPRKPILVQVK